MYFNTACSPAPLSGVEYPSESKTTTALKCTTNLHFLSLNLSYVHNVHAFHMLTSTVVFPKQK